MRQLGRLGLGGVAACLIGCGGTTVGVVGHVGDPQGGSAGSGGSGGYLNQAGGGSTVASAMSCPSCELVTTTSDVRGFAANDKTVYWIEYGTRDELDDYNDDGSLVARDLDSGKVTTVVRELYGPEALGISANYAYVFLNNQGHPLLRRYPLDSAAAPEDLASYPVLQRFPQERAAFAATRDFSYFQINDQLHRVAETPGAKAELVFELFDESMLGIAADESHGYFRTIQALYSLDAPGGEPTRLAELPFSESLGKFNQGLYWLRLVDGYFYGFDGYATRFPVAGGPWKRFADLEHGWNLQVLGDYYYGTDDSHVTYNDDGWVVPEKSAVVINRGPLNAPADRIDVALFPYVDRAQWIWCPTRTGVYFATATAVYFAPSP